MIHPSRTTRSRRPSGCDFALSLPPSICHGNLRRHPRIQRRQWLFPLSLSLSLACHKGASLESLTHRSIWLSPAPASPSHSPSLAPIAVLALFTDGSDERTDGRWSRRAAKSTEFHVFHVVWLPPSLPPAIPPPLHARAHVTCTPAPRI